MTTQPEPECVRIKRLAQEAIARATEGMSPRERDIYINEHAAAFAKRLGFDRISSPIGRGPEVRKDGDRRAG